LSLSCRYVRTDDERSIETITITADELLKFLRDEQKVSAVVRIDLYGPCARLDRTSFQQAMVKRRADIDGEDMPFELEPITTVKQVEDLIDEYEPNSDWRRQHVLGFDGRCCSTTADRRLSTGSTATHRSIYCRTRSLTDRF
jgi:hypothetical protein